MIEEVETNKEIKDGPCLPSPNETIGFPQSEEGEDEEGIDNSLETAAGVQQNEVQYISIFNDCVFPKILESK